MLCRPPLPPSPSYQVHEEEMKELVYLRDMYTDLQRYLFLRNLQVRAALEARGMACTTPLLPAACHARCIHPVPSSQPSLSIASTLTDGCSLAPQDQQAKGTRTILTVTGGAPD